MEVIVHVTSASSEDFGNGASCIHFNIVFEGGLTWSTDK